MIAEKTKAVATTTAFKTEIPNLSYNSTDIMSNQLKIEIGELLFCLEFPVEEKLRHNRWKLFERILRNYVDLRISLGFL